MPSSFPVPEGASDDFPTPTAVRRLATRGQSARFRLSGEVGWSRIEAAVDRLRAELPDDVLIIASPGGGSVRSLSLTAL